MGYEQILYEVRDRIATITLNRPDRLNAWTQVMGREVRQAVHDAARDEAVRVIVLTGAGRGFCAGADMELLSGITAGGGASAGAERARPAGSGPETVRAAGSGSEAARGAGGGSEGRPEAGRTEVDAQPGGGADGVRADFRGPYAYFPTIPKPILGALNGPTAGLGLVIALYCDVRFAADTAVFTTAFSRRGLVAEHGISWTLPRLVGLQHALDLLLSARKIDAAEALRIGLVNRVFPAAELMAGVRGYAAELAELVSPRSMKVMKRQLWEAQFQTLAEASAVANEEMRQSFTAEDFKEGVAHFVEKRAPHFTGR
jgi:enoyl-CoA hydratase/carnithine racemase